MNDIPEPTFTSKFHRLQIEGKDYRNVIPFVQNGNANEEIADGNDVKKIGVGAGSGALFENAKKFDGTDIMLGIAAQVEFDTNTVEQSGQKEIGILHDDAKPLEEIDIGGESREKKIAVGENTMKTVDSWKSIKDHITVRNANDTNALGKPPGSKSMSTATTSLSLLDPMWYFSFWAKSNNRSSAFGKKNSFKMF